MRRKWRRIFWRWRFVDDVDSCRMPIYLPMVLEEAAEKEKEEEHASLDWQQESVPACAQEVEEARERLESKGCRRGRGHKWGALEGCKRQQKYTYYTDLVHQ